MRWNLDDLYPSLASEAFQADAQAVDTLAAGFTAWSRTLGQGEPTAALREGIGLLERFHLVFLRTGTYAALLCSVDTGDTAAQAELEKLMTKRAALVGGIVALRKYLQGLGEGLDALTQSDELKPYAFFLKENQQQAAHMLGDEVEQALSLLEITGSQAWSQLHSTLTSTVSVDYALGDDQRTMTLPMVRNLASDPDPAVRRAAYEAELACYPKIEKSGVAALNSIKGEVLTKCRMRGFASPLDQTLFYARMDRATLDAMLGAMEQRLDVFRMYLKAKAKLLGKPALPFYDMFAPVGNVSRRYTLEQARDFLVSTLSGFDPSLSSFVERAFQGQWLDTEPREGKQGGAFCAGVHAIGQSRILSNFDGSYGEVLTLAHELGHAWHGECLRQESVLNTEYPMQLAETASTFNELLVNGEAMKKAEGLELLGLLDADLDTATQVVVDILSRYYFETEVFRRRQDGVLSAQDCKDIMLDAQRRAYGDGLDPEALHPYMWLCKGHYYGQPDFYNWPYAFGLLFALGLYGVYQQRGPAFAADYRNLLRMTGSADTAAVGAAAGVDVRDRGFWLQSLGVLEQRARRFAELVERA